MSKIYALMDKTLMKRSNARLVFNEIYRSTTVSRSQLASLTGLSAMSIGRIADELITRGLVGEAEDAPPETAQGRPAKRLHVTRESLQTLCVSMDREGFSIGIVDPYGTVQARHHLPVMLRSMDPAEAVKSLSEGIRAFLQRWNRGLPSVIGVSVPGMVYHKEGIVRFSSLLCWENVPLAALLGDAMPGCSVVIDNDVKALVLAECRFGVAAGRRSAAVLSLGSGIGAAAYIDGAVYRGENNTAGEIGHVVLSPDGRMCECGKIGCLQTNLIDRAIEQQARAVVPGATLHDVFGAYAKDAPWAAALVSQVVKHASLAIGLLENMYAPSTIVLCGTLIGQYPVLWPLIQAKYHSLAQGGMEEPPALVRSGFGADGDIIGASAIALEKLLDLKFA